MTGFRELAISSLAMCLRDQGASSVLCEVAKNAQHNHMLIRFMRTPEEGCCQEQVQTVSSERISV